MQQVNDLMDFAKMASATLELDRSLVNPKQLISKSLKLAVPIIRNKNQSLKVYIDPSIPPSLIDAYRFEQVFLNLVTNASKYTQEGGLIKVRAVKDNSSLLVEVSDNGRGIAPDDARWVFEPYFQVQSTKGQGNTGAGLGLAIAKSLITLHGGTIWVTSELDKGSTFSFTIPIITEHE